MTDPMAFLLGMVLVWAYVERRPIALWIVTALGAITWPALVYAGAAALMFPRPEEPVEDAHDPRRWVAIAVGAAAAAIAAAWMIEELVRPFFETEGLLASTHRDLWPASVAVIAVTSGLAAFGVARAPRAFAIVPYLRRIGPRRLAIGAIATAALFALRAAWIARAGNGEPGISLASTQHVYAAYAMRGPGWSLVHHVVYFGPLVVLAILTWPGVAARACVAGPSGPLLLAMVVVTAVTPESRHLTHLVPFVLVLVISSTNARWTRGRLAIFAILAFAWSKVWWHIGYDVPHEATSWPDLRYTMHLGPWASDATFLAHLAAAIVTAAILAISWRRATEAGADVSKVAGSGSPRASSVVPGDS
jgi:hypothetical protein